MRPAGWSAVTTGILATVAILALIAGPVAAQASPQVTPSFGDGRLTITGSGFVSGERVALSVRAEGAMHRFAATADAQGQFRVETGLALRPGASVAVEAIGDRGSAVAVITSGPGAAPLPPPAGPPPGDPPRPPAQLPRVGNLEDTSLLAVIRLVGSLCAGTGLALRLWRRRSSSSRVGRD